MHAERVLRTCSRVRSLRRTVVLRSGYKANRTRAYSIMALLQISRNDYCIDRMCAWASLETKVAFVIRLQGDLSQAYISVHTYADYTVIRVVAPYRRRAGGALTELHRALQTRHSFVSGRIVKGFVSDVLALRTHEPFARRAGFVLRRIRREKWALGTY